MKEYIERDALLKEIESAVGMGGLVAGALRRYAMRVPAADVAERKRGRWIWSEENECWVCNNCEMSALNNYRGNSAESNFCPNCGADMREVDA